MFVKKDLRKIHEIVDDHHQKKKQRQQEEPSSNHRLDLHLSKRKAEFQGSIRVLCEQAARAGATAGATGATATEDENGGDNVNTDGSSALEDVKSLSLYDCEISNVEGISKAVPRLEDLSLGGNPLADVADVGDLHLLRRLWLDDCRLSSVDSLLTLTNLEELRLSGNRLMSLPPDLGDRLYQLRVLSVDRNSLAELPASLAMLSGLEVLQVRQNQLTELPAVLPPSLRVLHASSNALATLPESLFNGGCPRLERVYLNGNQLTEFVIGNDSNNDKLPTTLEHLNLANNAIDAVPQSWRDLLLLLAGDNDRDKETGTFRIGGRVGGDRTEDETMEDGEHDNNDGGTGGCTIILRDNPILDDLQQGSHKMDVE